jgi:hypothetical protein
MLALPNKKLNPRMININFVLLLTIRFIPPPML